MTINKTKHIISISDAEIDLLEEEIPMFAKEATALANKTALSRGYTVTQVIDDVIYRISPNGIKQEVKKITQSRNVITNTKFSIAIK